MTPEDSAARQLEVVVPSAVFFLFQGTLGGTLSLPPVAESARPRLSDLQNCILSDQCEISSRYVPKASKFIKLKTNTHTGWVLAFPISEWPHLLLLALFENVGASTNLQLLPTRPSLAKTASPCCCTGLQEAPKYPFTF